MNENAVGHLGLMRTLVPIHDREESTDDSRYWLLKFNFEAVIPETGKVA